MRLSAVATRSCQDRSTRTTLSATRDPAKSWNARSRARERSWVTGRCGSSPSSANASNDVSMARRTSSSPSTDRARSGSFSRGPSPRSTRCPRACRIPRGTRGSCSRATSSRGTSSRSPRWAWNRSAFSARRSFRALRARPVRPYRTTDDFSSSWKQGCGSTSTSRRSCGTRSDASPSNGSRRSAKPEARSSSAASPRMRDSPDDPARGCRRSCGCCASACGPVSRSRCCASSGRRPGRASGSCARSPT